MSARPTFVIRLQPKPGVDAVRALRQALKVLLRRFGLKAIEVKGGIAMVDYKKLLRDVIRGCFMDHDSVTLPCGGPISPDELHDLLIEETSDEELQAFADLVREIRSEAIKAGDTDCSILDAAIAECEGGNRGMAATSTIRSRRCRERERNGLIRVTIEVDEDKLCEWLIAGGEGPLNPLDADRHDKVEQALERAVTLLMCNALQRPYL
jgi:hypothetical protein